MTSCEEIRAAAAGLLALPEGDPERGAAFAHAEGCARCTGLLREGQKLQALLDDAPVAAAPSPRVLASIRTRIHAELEADAARRRRSRIGALTLGVSTMVSLAIALTLANLSAWVFWRGEVCFSIELGAALVPVALLALTRTGLAARGPLFVAGLAALAAVGGQLWLAQHCPFNDSIHQVVFHFGGTLVSAALGAFTAWAPTLWRRPVAA